MATLLASSPQTPFPICRSSAHLSRQPPCSRDTEIIAQNNRLHALHLCLLSTTTRALGPALGFLPLARERASGHNRWSLVCGGGYPIQGKNQVLFSCFLRFAHVAPPAALPFLLCLPQPPSSPPAAEVCVWEVGGVGRWGAGGAGARSWEDCLGSAGSVFGIL